MLPAAFIDANVPIYAAGRDHPYREPCIRVLAAVNDNPEAFVANAEVFQEIMHHYLRTERWDAGPPAPGGDAPLGRDPHRYDRRRLRRGAWYHQAGPGRRQRVEAGVRLADSPLGP